MSRRRGLTAGADVWLNTPLPPLEASGTSGMKAALNGVPSLSVLDGWWLEGHIEGVTGWAIGQRRSKRPGAAGRQRGPRVRALRDARANRPSDVLPAAGTHFVDVMRHAIALNGSFFNAQRMLQEYVTKAYDIEPYHAAHNAPAPVSSPGTHAVPIGGPP